MSDAKDELTKSNAPPCRLDGESQTAFIVAAPSAHPPVGLRPRPRQLRRPWPLDERLRAGLRHPPAGHATILGKLLSLCLAEWIHRAYAMMVVRAEDPPPELGIDDQTRYETRARLAIIELSQLFDVDEPDFVFERSISRWRWVLYHYSHIVDVQLHERLETLCMGHPAAAPASIDEARDLLVDRRQLDVCVGVLLARAAMLDPRPRPKLLGCVDDMDDMDTSAVGTFACWCRWFLDAWGDDYPLGERLHEHEIEAFMASARLCLRDLDAELLAALVRVFPSIAP